MSTADELIRRLREQPGVSHDSEGRFTLDREKARAKLRQYQLADPHRYVLALVEAATIKGATRIEFRIDADDTEMSFDGQPFVLSDVDELYGSLFAARRDAGMRARRELAIGLNAAMALNPKWVLLESGAGGGLGVRLRLRAGEPDQIEELANGVPSGTRIHVKSRFRPGLILEFVREVSGLLAEEVVLRERCRFASVPIVVDGRTISSGLPGGELLAPVEFSDVGFRGLIGLGSRKEGGLRFLSNGIQVVDVSLSVLPNHFRGVVDCTHLEKDVSQGDFRRDEAACSHAAL